jgi:hypothetical protein
MLSHLKVVPLPVGAAKHAIEIFQEFGTNRGFNFEHVPRDAPLSDVRT